MVRQAVLPNVEAAEADIASHTGSSADLLRMLAQRFLLLLDSDLTAIPKLVVAESGNFPAIAQFYADAVLRRAFSLIEGILIRGIKRGEFRQMDVHATLPLFAGPFLCWRCGSIRWVATPTSTSIRAQSPRRISRRCCAGSHRTSHDETRPARNRAARRLRRSGRMVVAEPHN